MTELNWLKYFHEVAKNESVTQASTSLRVSQPAVTKMIKQLESQLGYALFKKSGRRLKLTSEGKHLFVITKELFAMTAKIKKIRSGLNTESEEQIRVGASDHLCHYVLPDVLKTFSKSFKSITYSVYGGSSSDIKQKLLNNEIDAGLFYTRLTALERIHLEEKKIASVEFVVAYSKQLGEFKSIEHFNSARIPYIGAREIDYVQQNSEQWIYNRLGLKIESLIQANGKEIQKQFVLKGLGFGVFPKLMVIKELESRILLTVKNAALNADLLLVQKKHDLLSPQAAKLVSEIVDQLKQNFSR